MRYSSKNILIVIAVSLSISCNSENGVNHSVNDDSEQSQHWTLNIESSTDCLNYLKGKKFYSTKARVEFQYDCNAYVYSNTDNSPVFAGYITLDPYQSGIRIIKINDTLGSGQVILLSLSKMGELIDLSDYTVYQTR